VLAENNRGPAPFQAGWVTVPQAHLTHIRDLPGMRFSAVRHFKSEDPAEGKIGFQISALGSHLALGISYRRLVWYFRTVPPFRSSVTAAATDF
jgi:hypothetical protein